jgi:hypothetical protein
MTKSALNKMLALEADEIANSALEAISQSLADGQADDSTQPHAALTLDQRSNLFLNAVYGARDYTSEEYAKARENLLDAMAANFTAHPKSDVSDLDDFNLPVDSEAGHLSSEIQDLIDEVRNASHTEVMRQSHAIAASIPRSMNRGSQSLEPLFCIEGGAPEPGLQSSIRASSAGKESGSRRMRTRLRFYGSIAATVALILTSSAVLFLLFSDSIFSNSKHFNTIADLSSERLNGILSQRRPQEASSFKRSENGSGIAQRLLDLGNRLIASGDLKGGRIVLAEAADEGSGSAALNLGSSFDPSEEGSLESSSDPDKARVWYQRAKQLGEPGAQVSLDRLDRFVAPR